MNSIVRLAWANAGEGSRFQEFIYESIDIPMQPIADPATYVLRNPPSTWAVTG